MLKYPFVLKHYWNIAFIKIGKIMKQKKWEDM